MAGEVDLFLDMMAAERGAARNTLDAYRRDLEDYAGFLASEGAGPKTVTTATIRDYLADCRSRGLQTASVARRLSAVRQFHRFLYGEGISAEDPAAVLEGPKRGRPLPKTLGMQEVEKLLAVSREGIDDPGRPSATGCARRGSPACSNFSMPPACACPSSSPCPWRPPGATSVSSWCAARATRSASCR